MARRKTGEGFDEFVDAPDDPLGGDGGIDLGFRPNEMPMVGGPMENEFNLRGVMPRGLPSGDSGNTERGRDLQAGAGLPTTPSGGDFGLPKGVSVNEGMFSDVPKSGNSMDAPAMPMSPSPISARPTQPGYGMPEGGINRGPQRRSPSSPAIYGETNNPSLFGSAGGLLGGGKGAVGTEEPSGPLAPTEMMKRLLQMFRQG